MSDELEIREEPGEVSYEPLPEAAAAAPAIPAPAQDPSDLDMVLDVPVELSVEIGRTTMTIRETLEMGPGSIVALDRMTGEPVDLLVNGQTIAQGEVVAIDEEFGLRITHVVSPKRRLDAAA